MTMWVPRAYQTPMVDFALRYPRVNLQAGMGTGKTAATLSVLDCLFLAGEARRALVLAPKRVALSTWPDEIDKWANFRHLTYAVACGSPEERMRALMSRAQIVLMNYENAEWLIHQVGARFPFDVVVCDESTKLKGFRGSMRVSKTGKRFVSGQGSKRALALARVAHVKGVRRWINLTGTPATNGLVDLWGQQWFVDGGVALGRSFSAFEERWFYSIPNEEGYPTLVPHDFAEDQIFSAIRPTTLSVQAKDHFDLPPLIEKVIEVDLPPAARRVYDQIRDEFYAELKHGAKLEAFTAAARSGKLLQIASGAVYTDCERNWTELHRAKLDALEDVIEEAAGMPVLIAYHWRHDVARLKKAFPRGRVLDDNPQTIRDWNAGRIPILFAHPKSAGHGLQLQDGGNIICYFSSNWNLEHDQQILERIGPTRQAQAGHNRAVHLIRLVGKDTLESTAVLRRLKTKISVMNAVLDAMGLGDRNFA